MTGVVTKVTVGGGSGGAHKGRRGNAVRVRWASGSEGRHDAHMIVKTEESGSAPELEAVMLEVSRTFAALNKARARFNRCSKPESREAARAAMVAAEAEYRQVADRRDRLVELRNANRTVRP